MIYASGSPHPLGQSNESIDRLERKALPVTFPCRLLQRSWSRVGHTARSADTPAITLDPRIRTLTAPLEDRYSAVKRTTKKHHSLELFPEPNLIAPATNKVFLRGLIHLINYSEALASTANRHKEHEREKHNRVSRRRERSTSETKLQK